MLGNTKDAIVPERTRTHTSASVYNGLHRSPAILNAQQHRASTIAIPENSALEVHRN